MLGNLNKNIHDILYLRTPTDKYKGVYLQERLLFKEREEIFKKLSSKGLIKSDYEESNAEKTGGGLKILTPSQMLSRLPISLARLNAGNNSENLKTK